MFGSLINRVSIAIVSAITLLALITGAVLARGDRIEGLPASFQAGGSDGYYLWHDEAGLHLRTTDSSGSFTYSGMLSTKSAFTNVQLVRGEKDDSVQLLDGGKILQFQFATYQGVDGIDFRVDGGDAVELLLMRNGKLIDPANIFLGAASVHPEHNPMWIGEIPDSSTSVHIVGPILSR